MSLQALSDYTRVSRYANYLPEEKRRENWDEQTDRVFDMHLRRYPQVEQELKLARECMREKKVLGSQRALQFGGPPIEKKHARLYNCWASFCDRTSFFKEGFWILLCGGGIGFSVQKHHVERLPEFQKSRRVDKPRVSFPYIIEDSIEGWAFALDALVGSYLDSDSTYSSVELVFDYSKIRPKGASLSSSSGKAPGPEPLRKALEAIRALLNQAVTEGDRLRPIHCYDIMMHSSEAVLAGGIRRSAAWVGFSFDDEEMLNAKTGNWAHENKQRSRSNNSVYLLRGGITWEQFHSLIERIKGWGEPGFYWTDSLEQVPNPCVEIGMWPVLKTLLYKLTLGDALKDHDYNYDGVRQYTDGEYAYREESGWQACNLATITGIYCKTESDFYNACVAAAIIGTVQAGYTDFAFLGNVTEQIVRREALLGVSITGINDSPEILLDERILAKGAEVVKQVNQRVSRLIGINPAARSTCVKPEGTASCLAKTASGIHRHHATRYFRLVQSNKQEVPLQHFKRYNPHAVEECSWSQNKTDEVIYFCIEVPKGSRVKNQRPAVDMLQEVKTVYKAWVANGKRPELCTQPYLTHNVSNTVDVRDGEWEDVARFIFENQDTFAGVSLISDRGDKDYKQAPNCAVFTPRELVSEYGDGAVIASGVIEAALQAFDGDLWQACDVALGLREVMEKFSGYHHTEEKEAWYQKALKFAERYFDDTKKMTYCLKDVHNWKKWLDLRREWQEVDYSIMVEEEDNTNFTADSACGGGRCEIGG
jgi:ribonucleoside-triphosphate reductase